MQGNERAWEESAECDSKGPGQNHKEHIRDGHKKELRKKTKEARSEILETYQELLVT